MKNGTLMVIFTLLLYACAHVPTDKFVQTEPSYGVRIAKMKSVAIVADVCLMRDVTEGEQYWSIKDSRVAAKHMLESAKIYLANKGYDVVFTEAPFVGSFKSAGGSMKYAAEEGGQIGEMHPPLFVAEGLVTDPGYRQSLTRMISATTATSQISPRVSVITHKPILPAELCCANIKDALDIVSKKTGSNAILFLVSSGVIVPAGKTAAQAIATGVISTVLTLGMLTVIHTTVSYLDTYATLVDVETGDILWSNSMRLKEGGLTDSDYYSKTWSNNILYHIPSRMNSKAN